MQYVWLATTTFAVPAMTHLLASAMRDTDVE
jgi:hypothetical protein